MAAEYRHVTEGDPLSAIGADTWNAVVDGARDRVAKLLGQTGDTALSLQTLPALTILVENVTGGNQVLGAPVRLDVESYTIGVNFRNRPTYKAKVPTGNGLEVIAILAEPIYGNASGNAANGTGNGIGRAVVLGHAIANISISNTSHRYAIAVANDTARLHSNATTGFPLIGNITGTGNLTLGVLVDRVGAGGNSTTNITGANVHFGQVNVTGNLGNAGNATNMTLLANGVPVGTSGNWTFSYQLANTPFRGSQFLGGIEVGNLSVPFPLSPADDAGNHGWVSNTTQVFRGPKTFRDDVTIATSSPGNGSQARLAISHGTTIVGNGAAVSLWGPGNFIFANGCIATDGSLCVVNKANGTSQFEVNATPLSANLVTSFYAVNGNAAAVNFIGNTTRGGLWVTCSPTNKRLGVSFGTVFSFCETEPQSGGTVFDGQTDTDVIGNVFKGGIITTVQTDASAALTALGLQIVTLDYLDHDSNPQSKDVVVPI